MRIRLVFLAISMLLLIPAAAHASLAGEQRQGQDLVTQLQANMKTCRDLSADDFDHIGEYVMGRALGSTAAHQAMNERMTLMMGSQAEGRMHELLGARYVNCAPPAGAGTTNSNSYGYGGMGPGMMSGSYNGRGGWGPMMSSGDWSWMMGGTWQNLNRQDWQRLQHQLLGTNTNNNNTTNGWMVAAIALAALLLGASIAILAVRRRPVRRAPAPQP